MVISDVYIKNFKSFRGTHTIEDLDKNLTEGKNIILIGGLNGAGKTSFLEALTLCFYGSKAEHLYPTKGAKYENYQSFMCSMLNKSVIGDSPIATNYEIQIQVFLKDVNFSQNVSRNLSIRRTWIISAVNKQLLLKNEKLELLEDSNPLMELEESEYQERIDDILPYSISQFFFFDGEKIQDFAKDSDNEFAASLKSILGIELYNRLVNDLKEVRSRILRNYNKNQDAYQRLADKEKERAIIENDMATKSIEIGSIEEELEDFTAEKEKLERHTFRLTRVNASNREDYTVKRARLEQEKELLEVDYIEVSKLYLPFLLSYSLCMDANNQIELESEIKKWVATQEAIEPRVIEIANSIFDNNPPPPKPDLTSAQTDYYKDKITDTLKTFLSDSKPKEIENGQIIHNLSDDEKRKFKQAISFLESNIVEELQRKSIRLKEIDITLEKIKQSENRSGSNSEEIAKLFDELEEINEKIGAKKQQIRQFRDDNSESQRIKSELERELTTLRKKVKVQDKQKAQLEYCEKLKKATQDFIKKYQVQKATELEKVVLEMWGKLSRKKQEITQVRIAEKGNFDFELINRDRDITDKAKISKANNAFFLYGKRRNNNLNSLAAA